MMDNVFLLCWRVSWSCVFLFHYFFDIFLIKHINIIRESIKLLRYIFFKLFSPTPNPIFLGQIPFHPFINAPPNDRFYFQKLLFFVKLSSPERSQIMWLSSLATCTWSESTVGDSSLCLNDSWNFYKNTPRRIRNCKNTPSQIKISQKCPSLKIKPAQLPWWL